MKKIKELFAQLQLYMQLESALIEKVEEYEKRISVLEKSISESEKALRNCETKYSELLYRFKENLKK